MAVQSHRVEFWAVDRGPRDPLPNPRPPGTLATTEPTVLEVADDESLIDLRQRAVNALRMDLSGWLWANMIYATEKSGPPDPAKAYNGWEPFGVREDGSVVRFTPSRQNITFGDLKRGVEEGFIPARWDRILLQPDGGRGGGNPPVDIVEFLAEAGLDWATALIGGGLSHVFLTVTPKRVRQRRVAAAARRVADHWNDEYLDEPWALRAFLDLKPKWTTKEIALRLRVTEALAAEILIVTGYARRVNTKEWVLALSAEAEERRRAFDSRSHTYYS